MNIKQNLLLLLFFSLIHMQENIPLASKIQWAGISYINPNIEVNKKYPNLSILEPHLRKLITKKISELEDLNYDLQITPSKSYKDGSLAMILAIESENITKLEINILNTPSCISTYYISMQLIIYDPLSSSILQIVPFNARRIYPDTKNGSCNSKSSKLDLFRFAQFMLNLDIENNDDIKFYMNQSSNEMIESLISISESNNLLTSSESFFNPFLLELKNIDFNKVKNTNFFVGVSEVEFEPLALEQLSGNKEIARNKYFSNSNNFNSASYKVWIGQQFVKWFGNEFNYPLVPFIKGKALGKDLAIKFSDSTELLNLRLPELDWGFKIKIRGYKKVLLDESKGREALGWASFGNITLQSVGFKDYDSINVKHVITKEVNKGDQVDNWGNFDDSVNSFLLYYIKNIKNNNKKWISENTNYNYKEFIQFSKTVYDKLKL